MKRLLLKIIKFLCAHYDYDANGGRQSLARHEEKDGYDSVCSFCGKRFNI
jgi:hypothetical protein